MNIELLFEMSIYLIYIIPYYERAILKLQNDIINLFFNKMMMNWGIPLARNFPSINLSIKCYTDTHTSEVY